RRRFVARDDRLHRPAPDGAGGRGPDRPWRAQPGADYPVVGAETNCGRPAFGVESYWARARRAGPAGAPIQSVPGMPGLMDREMTKMAELLLVQLLLCLVAVGVFTTVWELERIRQILDKRP